MNKLILKLNTNHQNHSGFFYTITESITEAEHGYGDVHVTVRVQLVRC